MSEEGAEPLAAQLGSEPEFLADSSFDYSILSVTSPKHTRAILYFTVLAAANDENAKTILKAFYKAKVSEGGRGRRDILRMEAVRHGGSSNVESEIQKPESWVERNVTNRNWEQKERDRLGIDPKGEP